MEKFNQLLSLYKELTPNEQNKFRAILDGGEIIIVQWDGKNHTLVVALEKKYEVFYAYPSERPTGENLLEAKIWKASQPQKIYSPYFKDKHVVTNIESEEFMQGDKKCIKQFIEYRFVIKKLF